MHPAIASALADDMKRRAARAELKEMTLISPEDADIILATDDRVVFVTHYSVYDNAHNAAIFQRLLMHDANPEVLCEVNWRSYVRAQVFMDEARREAQEVLS